MNMKKQYIAPSAAIRVVDMETTIASVSDLNAEVGNGTQLVKGRDQFADDEEEIAAALAEDNKVDDYGNLW